MTAKEFDHMMEVCNYVFSAPPNSTERDRRLEKISEKDSDKLWDFYSGLCSGRIKRPEEPKKESEDSKMNINNGKPKRIENFEDFKKALVRTGTYQSLLELKKNNPDRYKIYQERLDREKAR